MSARLVVDVGALLYIGPIGTVPAHRCPGTIVAVGLDGPIELTIDASTRVLRCVTTPAGVMRAVRSDSGRVAVTLVDPALRVREVDDGDAAALAGTLEQLCSCFTPLAWSRYLGQLACTRPSVAIDPRVRVAAQQLLAAAEEPISSEALAASVSLSASRLEHLFSAQVGVPMRSYRLWGRLQALARAMAAGADLTRAAHAAGFYDSAHMNHAFRQALGIVPSFVFTLGLAVDVVERGVGSSG